MGDLAGTLQIAFDKRIYHSVPNNKISVIRTPNLSGNSSDYREYEIDLGARFARLGLPSFMQSYFESIMNVEDLCFNNATQFTIDTDEQIQILNYIEQKITHYSRLML